MKTGKEIKLKSFKDYNVVFGSVNNKNPKAMYISISAWAEPLNESGINYSRGISSINKKIKQFLFNEFYSNRDCDFDKDKTIIDLDIRESGIRFGKRSFMNCEITLFMNTEIPVNSERMLDNINTLTPLIIRNVFDKNDMFDFHLKKA
jgi:hypothetical protein